MQALSPVVLYHTHSMCPHFQAYKFYRGNVPEPTDICLPTPLNMHSWEWPQMYHSPSVLPHNSDRWTCDSAVQGSPNIVKSIVTGSAKTPMTADLIFHYEHNGTWTNFIQNKLHLSASFFSVAQCDPYKRSGIQMAAWLVCGWLWVAKQLCGVMSVVHFPSFQSV